MKLQDDGQLLTATIIVCFHGKAIQIDDMIVDTGSSHTLFSPDVLEEIGVMYENGDPLYEAYGIGGTVPFYTYHQCDAETERKRSFTSDCRADLDQLNVIGSFWR